MLGHRVIRDSQLEGWPCTNDLRTNASSPLYRQFCKLDETGNKTTCTDYFEHNNVSTRVGIRGLASGAFFENLKSSFVEDAGRYITDTDDPADYGNLGDDSNNVLIKTDMKTSFIIMVGIFFPSVTGVEKSSFAYLYLCKCSLDSRCCSTKGKVRFGKKPGDNIFPRPPSGDKLLSNN
jgi:potassium/chloride transporter 4/5/6